MAEEKLSNRFGALSNAFNNNRSPLYITVALLFYLVPVVLISLLFINGARENAFDNQFIGLTWIVLVFMPLMLTFGVFIVYRATYATQSPLNAAHTSAHSPDDDPRPEEEKQQWSKVINKAVDWHRFLMPLCLLNMFITLIGGFLLNADISSTGDFWFGAYTLPLVFMNNIQDVSITAENTVGVPSSLFYLGLVGFMFQFLESTRRRYVSRNLVPRFYLISSFRILQVLIGVVAVYLFLQIFITELPRELALLSAFLVGMFPLQILSPVLDSTRARLGMDVSKGLPLTLINGVDSTLESLLQEENIDSVQILATTSIDDMHKRTAIPKAALHNWQRQALLFNVLGTEELIHRFARIGINDFDDLAILITQTGASPAAPGVNFETDFTTAMRIRSDEEAMGADAFWRVLIQVLIREYLQEFPEARQHLPAPASNEVLAFADEPVAASEPVGLNTDYSAG